MNRVLSSAVPVANSWALLAPRSHPGLGVAPLAQAAASKKIPVGLQLYSVREQCMADLPGTLAAVSKIGYRAVEFAGYYGRSAKDLRKLLDDNGLVACGTQRLTSPSKATSSRKPSNKLSGRCLSLNTRSTAPASRGSAASP